MQVIRKDFPPILQDNEEAYFSLLEGVIGSVDDNSYLEIRKAPNKYSFRISPSLPMFINMLVIEINNLHNLLNIKVEYGKSLKNMGIITFFLSLTKN